MVEANERVARNGYGNSMPKITITLKDMGNNVARVLTTITEPNITGHVEADLRQNIEQFGVKAKGFFATVEFGYNWGDLAKNFKTLTVKELTKVS